jgi:hypothetical protein
MGDFQSFSKWTFGQGWRDLFEVSRFAEEIRPFVDQCFRLMSRCVFGQLEKDELHMRQTFHSPMLARQDEKATVLVSARTTHGPLFRGRVFVVECEYVRQHDARRDHSAPSVLAPPLRGGVESAEIRRFS